MQVSTIEPFWLARPAVEVAPDLIGCTLVRQFSDGKIIRGSIVETEAYGPDDPACHAYRRRTNRNEAMFGPAGTSYVYLIYGRYRCLNVVTDREGIASAVLIRALQLELVPEWIDRDRSLKPQRVAAGPGKLCDALQIDLSFNGQVLQPDKLLWLEHRQPLFQAYLDRQALNLVQTTRIGLSQGVDLPWRWYLRESPAVSKFRSGIIKSTSRKG